MLAGPGGLHFRRGEKVGSQRAGMRHISGRPGLVKINTDSRKCGRGSLLPLQTLLGDGRWVLAFATIGQGPRTFKGAARMGSRNPPLCCLCQLPIHRKPACQPSCPLMPVQRCQGTRRSKASWQLTGELTARPAGPSAPCCQLHACGRRAGSPSKWPRCQPLGAPGQLAS